MDIINSITHRLVVLAIIFVGIFLYIFNFTQMLRFNWYIDYFKTHDRTCKSRYEIERYRYRLYNFLYNIENDAYSSIYERYKVTYFMFITYFSIFVFVFTYVIYKTLVTSYTTFVIYIFFFVIWVVYTTVNGLILDGFNKINDKKVNKDRYLYKYSTVYKILNAIIYISNLKDTTLEYSFDKFNRNETLDKIIENNIATYENIDNVAKIKNIKEKSYKELDFVRYVVLDRMSPYYLKYFDNVYIILPEYSTATFDNSANIYLEDIFRNRQNTVDFVKTKKLFQSINTKIEQGGAKTNHVYNTIYETINEKYPNDTVDKNSYVEKITILYEEIKELFYAESSLEKYNKALFESVKDILEQVHSILNSYNLNNEYNRINELIHECLKEAQNAEQYSLVPNNDYIEYFLDNKDFIFEDERQLYLDFVNEFDNHARYIYAYLVYTVIALFLLLHYMYTHINTVMYPFIVGGILVSYFTIMRFYGYYNFNRSI